MGHEYAGIVEEVGSAVTSIAPGQFVVGSFFASDNTCEICRAGYQTSCIHREILGTSGGAQAQRMRVPLADGTLVATPEVPSDDLIPDFLAASDVLGTGWFGAVAAEAGPGKTVAVVGDGAVGLCAVLAAQQLGAERIIAMSRHEPRQRLAREFGATDIITERGDAGVEQVKALTNGLGAHSVIEAVGTQESMMQAIRSTRPGGHVGYVGVSHDVALPGEELFMSHVHLHGGPAPVRRFLPDLMDRIWNRKINPAKVFDLRTTSRRRSGRIPRHGHPAGHQSAAAPLTTQHHHRKESFTVNPSYDFTGQVALVTGAGSGMGLATARAFAEAGAAVVLADVNPATVKDAADTLAAAGHRALGVECDVSDEASVAAAVQAAVQTYGRLDMAFNNAGIQVPPCDAADEPAEVFDRVNRSTCAASGRP